MHNLEHLLQAVLPEETGFALVDRDLRVERFSELFARFAAPGQAAISGSRLDELYPEVFGLEEIVAHLANAPGESFAIACVNRETAAHETCLLDLKLVALAAPEDDRARLLFTVTDCTEQHRLQQQAIQQKNELLLMQAMLGPRQQLLTKSILGNSPAIMQLKAAVRKIAQAPASTILLQGESGTGKSHVARVIHYLTFDRQMPFIEVNCAALPENLLEAELFGYEKGAFTNALKAKKGLIEEAEGGTLFLDEIGELPINLQSKLLHVIETRKFRRLGSNQEQQVHMRCLAATNRDLKTAIAEKKFREDLFYRLNVVSLTLPPLRELGDDVILLAEQFIEMYRLEFKKNVTGLEESARRLLRQYDWPGNVRELRNLIERAMIFCETPSLKASDLALPETLAAQPPSPSFLLPEPGIQLEELEKSLLQQALQRAHGNKTRAAALLGLSRDTFRYRLEKFDIA